MTQNIRKNILWGACLVAVLALVGSAAVAQLLPLIGGPVTTPSGAVRPPLITPIRPPLISPIRL